MEEPIDFLEAQRNLERRRQQLEADEGVLRFENFRGIGDLTQKIVSSPSTVASTLKRNLPASALGQPTPRTTGSAISKRSGGNAVSTISDVTQALRMRDSDLAGSRLQALLRPLERSSLQPVLSDDGSPTTDWAVVGYRLTGPIPLAQLTALQTLVAEMLEPCGRETIGREALRCLTLTKSRERDAADLRLFAAALSDELAEFPADVVTTAFRKWARREKWWPSLSEIRDQCQFEMRWRRSLKIALDEAARQGVVE